MTSTSTFDRWEKDPLFAVAEEVQESADRMESVYRNWICERKAGAEPGEDASGDVELRRELHAALGTAKWQLEEFDRASRSESSADLVDHGARIRHSQFVAAIGDQISTVENSLRDLEDDGDGRSAVWVRLDEGERDELAMFLSCPLSSEESKAKSADLDLPSCEGRRLPPLPSGGIAGRNNVKGIDGEVRVDIPKNSFVPIDLGSEDSVEEKKHGHRRVASVGGNIGHRKNLTENMDSPRRSSDASPENSPPRVFSFAGLTSAAEKTWKMKKNGFRKWRNNDQNASESIPLQSDRLSRGLNTCYEKSKSCLSNCGDESYDKQIYGCIGAFQRQLQRSQYQIQYGRPIQVIFWGALAFVLIGFGFGGDGTTNASPVTSSSQGSTLSSSLSLRLIVFVLRAI